MKLLCNDYIVKSACYTNNLEFHLIEFFCGLQANSPSCHHCQPHCLRHGQGHQNHHSFRSFSAGRSRREAFLPIFPMAIPSGLTVSLSSGYHPQTNSQAKRKIQELGRYLWAYCQEDQYRRSCFLLWAEYAQNSLLQNTEVPTPFQYILGYQPLLFPWMGEASKVPAVDHWFRASKKVWD